jgi:hypothetical protein
MIGNRAMGSLATRLLQRDPPTKTPTKPPTIGNLPRDPTVPAVKVKLKFLDGAWREVPMHLEHRKNVKFSRATGWYDFVLKDGELIAVKQSATLMADPNQRRPGHTEAAGGGRVSWAGQVRFTKSGQVSEWNDGSGHYRPAASDRKGVVKAGFPDGKFKQHPEVAEARKNREPGPQLPVHQPDTKPKEGQEAKVKPGPPREKELEEDLAKSRKTKPPTGSGSGGGGAGGKTPDKTTTPPDAPKTPAVKTPSTGGGNNSPYVHSKHGKLDVDLGRPQQQGVKRALGSGTKLGGKIVRYGPRALRVWGALSALGAIFDTLSAFQNQGITAATEKVVDAIDEDLPPVSKLAVDAHVKKGGPLDNKKFKASAEYLTNTAGKYIDQNGTLTVPAGERVNEDEILSRIGWHVAVVERYRVAYTRLENVFADHLSDGAPVAEMIEKHRAFVSDVSSELFELAKDYAAWYRLGEELLYLHLAASHAHKQYAYIGGHVNERLREYEKWMEEAGDVLAWAEDLMADWRPRWTAGGRREVGTNVTVAP